MPIYPYMKGGKEHYYYAFEVKDKNGKRKTIKKRGFKSKTEARLAEAEARVAWEKGQYIDLSNMTFGEYLTRWLENKQDLSPETRYTYEGHLRNYILPELGHIPLQKINVTHIEEFVKTLRTKPKRRGKGKLADGTARKIFNIVQTAFNSAMRKELIAKNPFELLEREDKPKTSKPKIDYWTKEEVKTFFSRLKHRQKIMFVLAIYTGMRRGEILGLRWSDIDFEKRRIRIVQTLRPMQKLKKGVKSVSGEFKTRTIAVSPYVISELKKHRKMILQERLSNKDYQDHDLVVCQKNGKPVSVGNFSKFWKRIVEKTGMRYIRFHDLRHTCATLLLSAGVHPKIVQELLGHSSIKITLDTYSHVIPTLHDEAVKELDRMLN